MSNYEVEQSFRNLVIFYQKELIYIEKGEKASVFFSDQQRKKMIKQGVLERVYLHRGCRLKLTKKANHVLSSYMNQQI